MSQEIKSDTLTRGGVKSTYSIDPASLTYEEWDRTHFIDNLDRKLLIKTDITNYREPEIIIKAPSFSKTEGESDPDLKSTIHQENDIDEMVIIYETETNYTRDEGENPGTYYTYPLLNGDEYEKEFYLDDRCLPMHDVPIKETIINGQMSIKEAPYIPSTNAYDHPTRNTLDIIIDYTRNWEIAYGYYWEDIMIDKGLVSGYEYDYLRPFLPSGIKIVIGDSEYNIDIDGGRIAISDYNYNKVIAIFNNDWEYVAPNVHLNENEDIDYILIGEDIIDNERIAAPDCYCYAKIINPISEPAPEQEVNVTLDNLVFKYILQIEFDKGFNKIIHPYARASISGMAGGIKIVPGGYTKVGNMCMYSDYISRENNKIDFLFYSYGTATKNYNHTENLLYLDLMTFDGIKSYVFNITDQLYEQPFGGIIIIPNVEVE